METKSKIIKEMQIDIPNRVKTITILVLAGLINPKFKRLHYKMINKVGVSTYLDLWIYALNTADVPEMAVIALCRKRIKQWN